MNVNKQVIASTLIIMGVGIVHAWTATPPQGITRVVLGGYIFMAILSIVDLFGGGAAQLASALSLLAVVFVILYEGLPVIQQFGILTGNTPATPNPSNPAPRGANPGPQ